MKPKLSRSSLALRYGVTTLIAIGGNKLSEEINYDRRRFLGIAAMTIAAAKLGILPSTLESKIRSLKINKHRFKPA